MTARKKAPEPEPEVEVEEAAPAAESKRVVDPATGSPYFQIQGDSLALIEALLEEYIAENPDNGDGTHTHLVAIRERLNGVRNAQRAWQHITESPATSGAKREAEAAA